MEPGKVVAFFEQKRILCAVCLEVKGNKVHLLSEENREITLGFNRIVHTSPHSLNPTLPRETLVENLKKSVERQKDLMAAVSIRELWDLVWEERREFSLRELAELTFPSPMTFDQEMALFRALFEDRLYFKPKGDLYEPREKEKVEEIALQIEREAEQARELEEAGRWLARVWAGEAPPPPPKREEIIRLMKEFALSVPRPRTRPRPKPSCRRRSLLPRKPPSNCWFGWESGARMKIFFFTATRFPRPFPARSSPRRNEILSQSIQGDSSPPSGLRPDLPASPHHRQRIHPGY